jgi:hypothetical protein
MKRHATLLFVAVLAASFAGAAETFSPTLSPPASPAISADVRPISPAIAGKLAGASPKFTPPPQGVSRSPEPGTDLREIDKPRNGIIRLPNYIVREEKTPAVKHLEERDILTAKGRLDFVMRRHPGLHVGNLFGLNDGVALAMAAEQERLERKQETYDLVSLLPVGEAKKAKAIADAQFARKDFSGGH